MLPHAGIPLLLAFARTAMSQNSERAITPTGTQIGINPVTVDMPTITYVNIVYHSLVSEYVAISGSDMSWKQGDTQHITATVTNTDGGTTATVTQTAPVAAATKDNGDVDIIITPELSAAFKDLAASARTAAGCGAGLTGRDLAACGLPNFIESVMKADGVVAAADNALSARPLLKASDIAELVSLLKAGGSLVKPKFAVGAGVGAVAVWWYSETAAGTDDTPVQVIPVAAANMDQAASPTTTTGCPPSAPTGKNAPVCDDPDCVGKSNICSEGEWKYCKCLDLMHPIFEPVSEDTLNQQQEVLAAIISEAPTKPEEPKATCSPNANPYTDPIDMDIPFAHNLAAVFCKGDTSKEMKADLTNEDITSGGSKRSLLDKRTPPASSKSFPGYTFHFEYSPGEGDCSQDCTDAMKSLISKCEGISSHVMQPAGTMSLSCGAKYSYSITTPEPTTPPAAPPAIGPDGKSELTKKACRADKVPDSPTFDRSKALDAIAKLCKNKLRGDKNGCIQSTDNGLFIKAGFTGDRTGNCMAIPFSVDDYEYAYKDGFEAMCKWALQSGIDDCASEAPENKRGASNSLNCIDYTIYAFDKNAGVPDEDQCAWARGG